MNISPHDKKLVKSPYAGIDPFSYAARDVFFARDVDARSLIRLIVMYRGILLFAESGIGKSSLINSGLIPLAKEEGLQPERLRVHPKKGEEIIVERISERVEGKPPYLPSIFTSDDRHERVVLSVEAFLEILKKAAGGSQPLLIFDQFEEWITLFEEGSSGSKAEEISVIKDRIKNAIASIINDTMLPAKVLISFREDYLAKLAPIFKECPNLPDLYMRLTPLKGSQIYEVIRGPFEKYPGKFKTELSPSLVKKIQSQFEERMRGTDISLAEVQIVCERLFDSGEKGSKLEHLFVEEGGVQGILEKYLERSLNSLATDQREPAIALLSRMITSVGTRNVISRDDLLMRVSLEESITKELLNTTLDSLEQKTKLVRRERRREVYYYEIASEFLVSWISKRAQERKSKLEEKKLLLAKRRAEEERQRAEIQIRTNKRLRGLTIALVVLLVLVGYYSYRRASYLHGFVWEHVEYYNSFVKKWGMPVGVGKLTSGQVGRRAVSFKFIKKGHVGPVVKLIAVNSRGEPTHEHGIGTYFEPRPEELSPLRECQYEFVTNQDGQVVYEKASDKYGKLVWGFVYSPRSVKDRIAHAHFVGPDGYPKPKKGTAAEFIEFEYSPEGYEVIRRYFDKKGNPQLGPDKAYGQLRKFDQRGLEIELTSLSLDRGGKTPMIDEAGNATIKYTYDSLGNVELAIACDAKGNITTVKDGWAKVLQKYDESTGNKIAVMYFDTVGQPTLNKKWHHKMIQKYDDRGNPIEWAFFDNKGTGRPALTKGGYHKATAQHDARGNVIEWAFFDKTGKPTLIDEGYHRITANYDERGFLNESAYFDERGKPTLNKNGVYKVTANYDSRGNKTRVELYGEKGKPTVNKKSYAAWTAEYDGHGNIIRIAYFGIDGKPTLHKDGYHRETAKYDERGNQTEWAYFDESGKPTQNKDGYHRATAKYDGRGNQTEWAYFDESGKPTLHKDGYHRETAKYDERWNRLAWAYFDAAGKPTQNKDGYHRATAKYDEHGNQTEWAYFDESGKPTQNKDGYHRARTKYDETGNSLRWTAYYDVNNKLLVKDDAFRKIALVLQKRPEQGQVREQLLWLVDVIDACKETNDPTLMEEATIMAKALGDLNEFLKTGNQKILNRITRAVERFFRILKASMTAHQPRN